MVLAWPYMKKYNYKVKNYNNKESKLFGLRIGSLPVWALQ